MNATQIRETLTEMTAAMNEMEKREFAAESIASLEREALEKIFDRWVNKWMKRKSARLPQSFTDSLHIKIQREASEFVQKNYAMQQNTYR